MTLRSARCVLLSVSGVIFLALLGCNKETPAIDEPISGENKGHTHSGWWCEEHGIPEAECSMCSAKVEAERKKAGDWCDMHNRARSQCFLCEPSLKEKFASKYRVKYGKEAPEPTEREEERK